MRGPAFIIAAMALFALLDANSKLLSGRYPADQVIVVRYAALLLVLFGARALVPGLGGRLSTAHPTPRQPGFPDTPDRGTRPRT